MIQKNLILSIVLNSLTLGRLISPVDEATLNYVHILFEWEQEPDAVFYHLDVSKNESFTDIVVAVNDSSLIYIEKNAIEWESDYYWRIQPVYGDGSNGSMIGPNSFSTGQTLSDATVTINNPLQYSDGITIFSAFFNYYSAAIDRDGREIWNSGAKDIVYYNTSFYGQLFGCWLNNQSENNLPGIEFSVNTDYVWEEPNNEFLHHDLIQLPNGNYMGIVEATQLGPIPMGSWTNLFIGLGFNADGVTIEFPWVGDQIVEWDKETKEIVWRWNVFDHYNMDDFDEIGGTWIEAFSKLRYDWTHVNAVWFEENESVIYISSRHLSRITKIDYTNGNIIWNMGHDMPSGDVDFGQDLGFSFQHSLQILDNGNILTLDNGNLSQTFLGTDYRTTRALEIKVTENQDDMTAIIVWEHSLAEDLFGFASGNVQKLDNGNYLVTTVGDGGTVLEVTHDNETVWTTNLNLTLPSGAVYRAHRIAGLYPVTFSILKPEFMLIQSDGIVTGESSLDFFIINDGEKEETFYYEFYDHSGLFDNSSNSILIQQGEKIQLSFPQEVFDEEISYAFELIITPIHNAEMKKIICYPACTVNVFPGDTDNNGIVDEFDILPIGIYFNEKGNSRVSTGFFWNEYKVAKWDSVPVTYADANGDGTVDGRDVIGIGVNWENAHDISGKSYKITEGYIFTEIEKENLLQFYNSIFGTDVPSEKIRKLLEKILDINQPEKFLLLQNHPNPFNSNTTIGFNLPTPNTVSIRIFDILGREISVILDGKYYRAGAHSVQINSDLFSSSVYFYQVQSGEFINQKKMVILK